jgi:antitoxin component YwqK of YwqJK toxin-antitoxin module
MTKTNGLKASSPGRWRRRTEMKKSKPEDHVRYHKDGSVWARGQTIGGVATGYWEWFRKDGVRMRSGTFERGEQVGQWTTYDKSGAVYKVTSMKPKPKPRPKKKS